MKDKTGKQRDDNVLEQAARWYAETRDNDFSQKNLRELETWLAEDPEHQATFDEIQQTSLVVDELLPEGSPERKGLLNRYALPGKSPTSPLNIFVRWQHAWKKVSAAAAMIVLVILSISVFMDMWPQDSQIAVRPFHTAIGESREVVLKDGSLMKLNTNTMATIKFSRNQRLVELSDGEAFFDVVRDETRPFLVRALDGEVRVLGTAFNMRNRCGKVMVEVARGRVMVRKLGTRENNINAQAILSADQWVSYRKWGGPGKVQTGHLKCALAWQEKKLVFHSEPLADVLKQIEDYYPVRIKLAHSGPARELMTGTFDNSSLEEILGSIQIAFNLKAIREDGVIVLQKM
jgi:transmembrane sensor